MSDYKRLDLDNNAPASLNPTPAGTNTMTDSENTFEPFKCMEMIVTFNKTKLAYKSDDQIWAHFSSFSSWYEMKDGDAVGMIRLNDDQYLTSKKISECEVDAEMEHFDADWLDDEKIIAKKTCFQFDPSFFADSEPSYFQFCYKNQAGVVLGKSTPFQIKDQNELTHSQVPLLAESPVIDDNKNERQEEDDFIVVRSQESFLKERIEHLTKSNNLLQYLIRTMEKDLSAKANEVNEVKNELEDLKDQLEKSEKTLKNTLEELNFVNLQNAALLEEKMKSLDFVQNEKEKRIRLEKDLETVKTCKAQITEDHRLTMIALEETSKRLAIKENELSIAQIKIGELQKKLVENLSETDILMDDLKSRLDLALQERDRLSKELSQWKTSNVDSEERTTLLEKRIEELELINQKQSQEIKVLKVSLQSSNAALHDADRELKIKNQKIQDLLLKNDQTNVDYIQMRARLEQAKIEYGNLYNKCQSYQRKLARNQMKSSGDKHKIPTMDIAGSSASLLSCSPRSLEQNPGPQEDESKVSKQWPDLEQLSNVLSTAVKTIASSILDNGDDFVPEQTPHSDGPSNNNILDASADSVSALPDRADTIAMPCTMCDKTIECRQHDDGTGQLKEMIEHFEFEHQQKMCPVCSVLFDTRLPIFKNYFSSHVENHLSQMKYPK